MKTGIPTISSGNSKIGNIPNINLPPPIVCQKMQCLHTGCYAMKAWRLYPSVQQSWTNNYNCYKNNPDKYFQDIISILKRKTKPFSYFRWHSAGEIPDQAYIAGMFLVAKAFPKVRFLVFTKRYDLDFSGAPKNFKYIFSSWMRKPIPNDITENNTIAWVDDNCSQSRRIRKRAKKPVMCKGSCLNCKTCWHSTKDIIFNLH